MIRFLETWVEAHAIHLAVCNALFAFVYLLWSNVQLGRKRQWNDPHYTWYQFWVEQTSMVVLHPLHTVGICLASYIAWPLLALLELDGGENFCDYRWLVAEVTARRIKEEWYRTERSDFLIKTEDDMRRFHATQQQAVSDDLRSVEAMRRAGEFGTQIVTALMMVLSLLSSPIGVKKAKAAERDSDGTPDTIESFEKPFEPIPPQIHGVIMARTSFAPETGIAPFGVAMAHVNVSGAPADHLRYLAVFSFDRVAAGGDPVVMANGTWAPSDGFSLTAGRVLNPIGLSRLPAPHQKVELTYPATGDTTALFDDGVLAQLRPIDALALAGGFLTGLGSVINADAEPDAVARLSFFPSGTAEAALSGQIGQVEGRYRHTAAATLEVDRERLLAQAEAVQATHERGPDSDRVSSLGWSVLGGFRPMPQVDVYARGEAMLADLRESGNTPSVTGTVGANYRPAKPVAIRAAVAAPIPHPNPTIHFAAQIVF